MNAPVHPIGAPPSVTDRVAQAVPFFDDTRDLRELWQVIDQRKWSILALVVVSLIFAAQVLHSLAPIYESTVTVMIESQEQKTTSIEEVYGLNTGNQAYFDTQVEVIKSRHLAEKVVDRLNLTTHPEFDPRQKRSALGTREALVDWGLLEKPEYPDAVVRHAVVGQFQARLTVKPTLRTQLVDISFESEDPALAAKVANTLADLYIENDLDSRMQMTQRASIWMTERLSGVREALEATEAELQSYREANGLVDVAGVTTLTTTELTSVTSQLVAARRELAEVTDHYRQARAARSEVSGFSSLSPVLSDSTVRDLRAREGNVQQKIAELGKRYGPRHPRMVEAKAELQKVQRNMERQMDSIVASMERDRRLTQARVRGLEQQAALAKNQVQDIARKSHRLNELQRAVETNRTLYDQFFQRIRETAETGDFQSAHARVVDPAVVAVAPIKPRIRRALLLTAILVLLLGIGIAFLSDHLDNTFGSVDELERKLGVPVMGAVPTIDVRQGDKRLGVARAFLDPKHKKFAESIRTLRSGVTLASLESSHHVMMLTSSVPSEGKTTLSFNLALAFSQLEKTLLIEADLRRPKLGRALGKSKESFGLSHMFTEGRSFSECLTAINSNLDVLTAGEPPKNPLELIQSKAFAAFIQKKKAMYDRIIIDTAPVQAVSDALVISQAVESVFYVVRADVTPVPEVKRGLERLRRVGAQVEGVLINQVDVKKSDKYGYYSGYYGRYDYS